MAKNDVPYVIVEGVRIYYPATVEQMLAVCSMPDLPQIVPTSGCFRDLCERLLALEEARRG